MAFTIVKSKNIAAATACVLEQARGVVGNLDAATFVLVPDRFSLRAEQLLFGGKQGAMFNTHVVSFTKLAHIISGGELNVLSKQSSVMLLWKAITQVKDKLVRFNTACSSFTFAEKLYNTINQLVSSGVDFDKLEQSAKIKFTKLKFADISTIYKKYIELLGEKKTDSGGVLKYLIGVTKTSDLLKYANVFVCGFENLTPQRLAVIKQIVSTAKSTTVAVQDDLDKTMLQDLTTLNIAYILKEIPHEVKMVPTVLTPQSVFDECDDVVRNIVSLIKHGYRFRDVNLVLGSFESYAGIYATAFKENKIAAYFDEGENLCNSALFHLLQSYLLFAATADTEYLIQMIKNPLNDSSLEEKFATEKLILKTNPKGTTGKVIEALRKCKTAVQFCEAFDIAAQNSFFEKLSVADRKKQMQATEEIAKIFAETKSILGDMPMTALQFLKMFQSVATSVKLETVPDVADSVRVFDASNPEIFFNKIVIVAGAASNSFPIVAKDTDLITMQDIKNCSQLIVPSCTLSNLQSLQNAHNVLTSATDILFVSCSKTDIVGKNQSPSFLFTRLLDKFGQTSKTDFLFLNSTKCLAKKALMQKSGDEAATLASALGVGNLPLPNEKVAQIIQNADKLFFKKSKTSASQLECFFACPAKHFYRYGLRLKPFEIAGLNPMDTGKIIHTFCEMLVKHMDNKRAIVIAVDAAFETHKDVVGLEQNRPIIESLKKQLQLIGEHILHDIRNSEFKPIVEHKFDPVKIGGIMVGGQADRIDVFGDRAKIIDYKTGSKVSMSASEVFVGEKIQLIVYSLALKDKYKVEGVYYMPLALKKIKAKEADRRFELEGISGENLQTARQYVEQLVEQAVADINAGTMSPSVLNEQNCEYCEFNTICFDKFIRVGKECSSLKFTKEESQDD